MGVAVGDLPGLRQEVRPFVPLVGGMVIETSTNQLIILFFVDPQLKS